MKSLMQSSKYTKRVYGCAYIRHDWKNHKNHLKVKQYEWWWNRQVNAVAKVINTETYFIKGIIKPQLKKRDMTFTLKGYNTCGYPSWTQSFSFVIVSDPIAIYTVDDEQE